jgi:hypothetical protein
VKKGENVKEGKRERGKRWGRGKRRRGEEKVKR